MNQLIDTQTKSKFTLQLKPACRVLLFNQRGLKQTKSGVVWAHGGGGREGTQCANSRTVIAECSLTCMCEGTERADQGQQKQQLNIHGDENVSPPVTTFETPSGQRARHQGPSHRLPHTRRILTPTGLSKRGRVKDQKRSRMKNSLHGKFGQRSGDPI